MIALAKRFHFRAKNKSSESTITRKNIVACNSEFELRKINMK